MQGERGPLQSGGRKKNCWADPRCCKVNKLAENADMKKKDRGENKASLLRGGPSRGAHFLVSVHSTRCTFIDRGGG